MTDKIKSKVVKIVELAMLLNPTKTKREVTGDKPTVFVEFNGHVCNVGIFIHYTGWFPGADPDRIMRVRFDSEYSNPDQELDEAIAKLTEIYDEWKDREG